MFEPTKMFNGLFCGKLAPNMCRLTMKGGIAVKCSNGYKTYNIKKGTLTNVTNFCLNIGDEMFFVLPTNKVSVGDLILVDGKPKCVIGADKKTIQVIDYESSEVKTILPERHIFMGNAYFYGKVVSLFGNAFKGGTGLKGVMKMMCMMQMLGMGGENSNNPLANMFGGNGNAANGNNPMAAFAPFMMMNMMGDGNPFDDLFGEMNFDFIGNGIADDEESDDDDEVVPTKKSKKNTEEED